MRVALLTDTHWGVRGDSQTFLRHHASFHRDLFMPYLRKNGIEVVFHLGDVVDRRKFVNYNTARTMREAFFEPLAEAGIALHAIVGNHDTSFKNTNDVNALHELVHGRFPNQHVYTSPVEVEVGGRPIALVPWICAENEAASMDFVSRTRASVLFGHLELRGFEAYRGAFQEHGMDPEPFQKFDLVASGHYHHKSTVGCVHYLGAPYEMTWSDYDDARGFHVLDTDTLELTHVPNPDRMFHRLRYDDTDEDFGAGIESLEFPELRGRYVKVSVVNRRNPYWFDRFLNRIDRSGPADLQVVEDSYTIALEDDSDIESQAEDTLTIIRKYVGGLGLSDGGRLINLLTSLHDEALTMEG